MIASIITDNKAALETLCLKHKVEKLYVFGSAARNEMSSISDLDFIVKFKEEVAIVDYADLFFDLAEALETLFNRSVDLLTDKPIQNKYLKQELEESRTLVYHAA